MIHKNSKIYVPTENLYQRYRISWSAIISGVLVGAGLGFLLHIYGMAISLSAYSATSQGGASALAIGGFLGLLIGVIASMGAAGFVSGYLGRYHYYNIRGGIIYGFITWSLVILLTAVTAKPLIHYAYAYSNAVSRGFIVDRDRAPVTETTATDSTIRDTDRHPMNEMTPKELARTGWVIFALFFVGALSSCVGACLGLQRKRDEEEVTPVIPPTTTTTV